jgi:hypothetical protein
VRKPSPALYPFQVAQLRQRQPYFLESLYAASEHVLLIIHLNFGQAGENSNFRANWIWRCGITVEVITPAEPGPSVMNASDWEKDRMIKGIEKLSPELNPHLLIELVDP